MPLETADRIIDNVFKDIDSGDELNIAFQGGEPTLAGLPWFRHFLETAASKKSGAVIHYAFQTNGLVLNEEWCVFFRENNFLVGLSIDSARRFHDRNRRTAGGGNSFEACIKAKELLVKNHVDFNILSVLTNDLANEPDMAWRFIQKEMIKYIQFIPCLELSAEDQAGPGKQAHSALRPAQFAKFYSQLLHHWIAALEKGNYISIKLFDDVVNYFLKGITTACGIDGHCRNQFVIEADGSVYPCDFYCFDEYKTGNLAESPLQELTNSGRALGFINEKPELPPLCAECNYFPACRGGCKRMRNVMYTTGAVCGFRIFLEKCLGPLETTVRKMGLLG